MKYGLRAANDEVIDKIVANSLKKTKLAQVCEQLDVS